MDGIVRCRRLEGLAVIFLTWLLLAAPAVPASAQPEPPTPVLTANDLPAGYRADDAAQLPAGTTYLAAVTCTEDDGGYAGVDTRLAGWQGDGSAVFELAARPVSEEAAASLEGHPLPCGGTQQPVAGPGGARAAGGDAP